ADATPPAPAAAPAPAPVDLAALTAELLPALLPQLVAALAPALRVAQLPTGQTPAPAIVRTWGVPGVTFTKGEIVSHGYYSHVEGKDVVRYGLVVEIVEIGDGQGGTSPHYVVAWCSDVSDSLPPAELRAA
ncbi:MAG: hypothetical protein ACRDOE_02680, partial [Streptosporangiaceae bacterium]